MCVYLIVVSTSEETISETTLNLFRSAQPGGFTVSHEYVYNI
jgi:hypothetical protein